MSGTTANVTAPNDLGDGWIFSQWGSSIAPCKNSIHNLRCSGSISSDTNVYAYYKKKVTFTAKPKRLDKKDSNGNYVLLKCRGWTTPTMTGWAGYSMGSLTIPATCHNLLNNQDYNFAQWGSSKAPCNVDIHNATCNVGIINEDVENNVYYERSIWEGITEASGGMSGVSGWARTGNNITNVFSDCTNGCNVTFKHKIKRVKSTGSTVYTIDRTSNLTATESGKAISGFTIGGSTSSSNANGDEQELHSDSVTLYPGMVVCEKLSFRPYSDELTVTTTMVCAKAEGDSQPGDPDPDGPNGDQVFVNIKVKNSYASNTYHTYQRLVYAKPGDKLSWRSSYNPVLQYTAYLIPEQMRINNGTIHNNYGNNNLETMFNNKRGSLEKWNNAFTVQAGRNGQYSGIIANYKKPVGDFTNRSPYLNNDATIVNINDVGKRIDGRAITSNVTETQTTPGQVSFMKNGENDLGNVDTTPRYRVASANVPYNFDSRISVDNDENEPVYAGELTRVKINLDILPRSNSATMKNGDRNYATKLGNAKYKIIVYRGNKKGGVSEWASNNLCSYYNLPENETSCGYSEEKSGADTVNSINNGLSLSTGKSSLLNRTFYAPDAKAGEKICVSAAFWPANSGAPTNMDSNGSKTWRISDAKCFYIAKRPSIQAWGGNVYSEGSINTGTSIKSNLNGYTSYSVKDKKGSFVFGSWSELGVITNNSIKGFGSGASMGYAGNDGLQGNILSTWPMYRFENGGETARYTGRGNLPNYNGRKPGGSDKKDYCDRVPLTIPNTNCQNGGIVGSTTSMQSLSNAFDDKQSLVDILGGNAQNVANGASINQGTIGALGGGETKLVQSGGDIIIAGDLIYFDNISEYQSYRDIPKLVIYAENIKINCNVERIDALLIAKKAVLTCNNLGNINLSDKAQVESAIKATENNEANSRQLLINGAIIANKLIANRTYGAATGANSIISAEIINFDPTLYKFGVNAEDDEDVARRLDISSMREFAPRL